MKKLRFVLEQKFSPEEIGSKMNKNLGLPKPKYFSYWSDISKSILKTNEDGYERSNSLIKVHKSPKSKYENNLSILEANEGICRDENYLKKMKSRVLKEIMNGMPISSKKLKVAQQFLKMYPSLQLFYKDKSIQPILKKVQDVFQTEEFSYNNLQENKINYRKFRFKSQTTLNEEEKVKKITVGNLEINNKGKNLKPKLRHKTQIFENNTFKEKLKNSIDDNSLEFCYVNINNPLAKIPINKRIAFEISKAKDIKHSKNPIKSLIFDRKSVSVDESESFKDIIIRKARRRNLSEMGPNSNPKSPTKMPIPLVRRLSDYNESQEKVLKLFQKTKNKLLPMISIKNKSKRRGAKLESEHLLIEAERENRIIIRRNSCKCRTCGVDEGKLKFIRKLEILDGKGKPSHQNPNKPMPTHQIEENSQESLSTSLKVTSNPRPERKKSYIRLEKRNSELLDMKSIILTSYMNKRHSQEKVEVPKGLVKRYEKHIRNKSNNHQMKSPISQSIMGSPYQLSQAALTKGSSSYEPGFSTVMEYNRRAKFMFCQKDEQPKHKVTKSINFPNNVSDCFKKKRRMKTSFSFSNFSRIYGRAKV